MLSFGRTRYGLGCIGGALMIALVGCGSSSSDSGSDNADGQGGNGGNTQSSAGKGGGSAKGGSGGGSSANGGSGGGSSNGGSGGGSSNGGSSGGSGSPDGGAPDAATVVDAAPPVDKSYTVDITAYEVDDTGALKEKKNFSLLDPDERFGVGMTPVTSVFGGEILVTPDGKYLYASVCNDMDVTKPMRDHNYIAAFKIETDGSLTSLGRVETEGSFPRGVAMDPDGKWLTAINHKDGNILVFTIGADGKLTKKWNSASGVLEYGAAAGLAISGGTPAAAGKPAVPPFVFTQSGVRKILTWQVKADNSLAPVSEFVGEVTARSGTSFLVFNPKFRLLHSANDRDSNVTTMSIDAMGKLTQLGMVVRSKRLDTEIDKDGGAADKADLAAPVHLDVHPSGELAVTANYGQGVFMYKISAGGIMEPVDKGTWTGEETHAAKFHPKKDFVYVAVKGGNKKENNRKIVRLTLDRATGKLSMPTETTTAYRQPRHIAITPDGKFLYVVNERSYNNLQP